MKIILLLQSLIIFFLIYNLFFGFFPDRVYIRDLWGKGWGDIDKDGENTRVEILKEKSLIPPKIINVKNYLVLKSGKWQSHYINKIINKTSNAEIDHVVPVYEAFISGGCRWNGLLNSKRRYYFYNDPSNLVIAYKKINRKKSAKDPAEWLPKTNKKSYLKKWIEIKEKYNLSIDKKESKIYKQFNLTHQLEIKKNACKGFSF